MYITGAKFEEHCSNISRDILDSVFNWFSEQMYDVITLSVSNKASLLLFFYFIRT